MVNKNDIKTAGILDDASELELMCRGRGWAVAKEMLTKDIMEVADILELKEQDPTKLMAELGARQIAVKILWGWLRKIDSTIISKNAYEETFKKDMENSFINYGNHYEE
jgi:hypothetical protein